MIRFLISALWLPFATTQAGPGGGPAPDDTVSWAWPPDGPPMGRQITVQPILILPGRRAYT